MTVRLADTPQRIDLFLTLLEPLGIVEMARSGPVVMGLQSQ
jgi:acetolactate synthase small subunit